MYLLPCPNCQASIPLSPSQAGDQTTCSGCQSRVEVPNLGQLRRLPTVEDGTNVDQYQGVETSTGRITGFVILGLIATASILVASFCGIRWSLIEVTSTTEEHVAGYREAIHSLTAAELIREYEQMEEGGFELGGPHDYKRAEMIRNDWGRNASIAAAVGGLAVLGALALVGSGRRNRT